MERTTNLIRNTQPILQQPCLFQGCFHSWIISGPVNLLSRFTHPRQDLLNLNMRLGTIANWCLLEKFGEEKWVTTHSLDRLENVREYQALLRETASPLQVGLQPQELYEADLC